jgi:oligosaccharide repeat unit polymerase
MLPLTLFFLRAIRKGHLDLTRFAAVVAISVSAFLVLFYIINMQYQTGSIVDVVENWFVILASYTFGGLVSFGQVVLNPTVFENNQSIWRFFIETANSLGANVPIPSLHAGYTSITNYQDLTNIYTIYFSYYMDYGIFGVIVLMFLLGVFLGWVYRQACRGELLCTFFYASFCVAIVLSLHSERFFTALNYYLKQLIFLLVVFWLPTAIVRVASRRVRAIGA